MGSKAVSPAAETSHGADGPEPLLLPHSSLHPGALPKHLPLPVFLCDVAQTGHSAPGAVTPFLHDSHARSGTSLPASSSRKCPQSHSNSTLPARPSQVASLGHGEVPSMCLLRHPCFVVHTHARKHGPLLPRCAYLQGQSGGRHYLFSRRVLLDPLHLGKCILQNPASRRQKVQSKEAPAWQENLAVFQALQDVWEQALSCSSVHEPVTSNLSALMSWHL